MGLFNKLDHTLNKTLLWIFLTNRPYSDWNTALGLILNKLDHTLTKTLLWIFLTNRPYSDWNTALGLILNKLDHTLTKTLLWVSFYSIATPSCDANYSLLLIPFKPWNAARATDWLLCYVAKYRMVSSSAASGTSNHVTCSVSRIQWERLVQTSRGPCSQCHGSNGLATESEKWNGKSRLHPDCSHDSHFKEPCGAIVLDTH